MELVPMMQLQTGITRSVKTLTGTIKVQRRPPSQEALNGLGLRTKREIIGHLAINPPEIESQIRMLKSSILREMAMMSPRDRMLFAEVPIDFVNDKENRKKYWITCGRCGDHVAYVWANNEKLENWCDLHYVCWYSKTTWRGARAVNISPVDGKLGIECSCGEDTRDWRCAKNVAPIQKSLMIDYTQNHRDFGLPTSTFIATLYG